MRAAWIENESYNFVFDYALNGDLASFLRRQGGSFSEPLTKYYAAQLLDTLSYLRKMKIVHRDLKLANILINHKF